LEDRLSHVQSHRRLPHRLAGISNVDLSPVSTIYSMEN